MRERHLPERHTPVLGRIHDGPESTSRNPEKPIRDHGWGMSEEGAEYMGYDPEYLARLRENGRNVEMLRKMEDADKEFQEKSYSVRMLEFCKALGYTALYGAIQEYAQEHEGILYFRGDHAVTFDEFDSNLQKDIDKQMDAITYDREIYEALKKGESVSVDKSRLPYFQPVGASITCVYLNMVTQNKEWAKEKKLPGITFGFGASVEGFNPDQT